MNCSLCNGNHGHINDNGNHNLCEVLAKQGLDTPCLGVTCEVCNGAGTLGKGGMMLSFDLGPAKIKRAIEAAFPPCEHCGGKGYCLML